MSDSLPQPDPNNADNASDVPAQNVPGQPTDTAKDANVDAIEDEEIVVPDDPAALAADREGFKFIAVGFAIFFVIIIVCASIVALVMKNMGI